MYSLVFAVLLLVSINALTQVPSARPTADGTISTLPTPSPSSNLSPAISTVPTKSPINGALSRCIATDTPLDIIFMIDSSGSVFDAEYNNWQYELDLVYDIVDNVIPSNSRVALINFSGCGSSFTLEQCKSQGRFQQMISLSSNGSPNDLDAVLSTIDAIAEDDFLGGYTWTNEALGLALEEFVSNSTADSDKMIVLITDGEPYPSNQGHEPCKSSTGFVSDTLQALQQLDVAIITVGIDIADDAKEEYFDCISGTDFYFEGSFDSSSASNSNDVPSLLPTPAPVSQAQALSDGDTPIPSAAPGVTSMPTSGSDSNVSPAPTVNGSPSAKPTPSPTSGSGINLTTSPTSNSNTVPTYHPSPSPITAVEDLSDTIGDFICSELGSSRLIIPTTKPTPMPTVITLQGLCESSTELDIVFMVDSSGSVYDEDYDNWQSQLDLVNDIVNSLPATSTRASLINFSGCGSSFTFEQCKEQGRFDTVFELNTYGNDLELVSARISEMDSDDFNGGFTWTNEALGLALDQFNTHSDAEKTKYIVLLTDGEPFPYNEGHEPCLTSTNYESDTLIALNELGVNIITVGIDIGEAMKEETLDCVSETYFGVSEFSTLNTLSVEIGELICDNVNGDFSTLSLVPTARPVADATVTPTPSPTLGNLQGLCESNTKLDTVFMVDSSGSVYDNEYNNWQSQLDLVNDIVNSLPATSSRASLINFSGCGSSFTFEQCEAQGRFDTVFELNSYGNDLELVSARINEMDSSDFNGGFTWTNEALGLALNQFNTYSDSDTTKIIVLLTDGEPYPHDEGHEPCLTTTNYESDTLIALKELGVNIITVGIDISEDIKKEKLDCVSDSYLGASQFSTLESLSVQIAALICDNINGDFSTLTLTPTARPVADTTIVPTPSPVTNPSSIEPTPSPIKLDESTRGPITSNGIMGNIYINIAVIAGFIMVVLF